MIFQKDTNRHLGNFERAKTPTQNKNLKLSQTNKREETPNLVMQKQCEVSL